MEFDEAWSREKDNSLKFVSSSGCRFLEDKSVLHRLGIPNETFRCMLYRRKTISRKDRKAGKFYEHPVRGNRIQLEQFRTKEDAGMQLVIMGRILDKAKAKTSPTGILIIQSYADAVEQTRLRKEAQAK